MLLLGRRVRRLHRSLWLDGVVAGLTAAAFAAAFFFELAPGTGLQTDAAVAMTLAYPCFVMAALVPVPPGRAQALRGTSVMVVPAACAVAALGLLFYGTRAPLQPWADVLALSAALAALARMALTFREVESLREIGRQATIDELTGLANRRAFYTTLRRAAADGRRLAVLILDLDRFKDVNDSLGHHTGDELLRMVARRLSDALDGKFLPRSARRRRVRHPRPRRGRAGCRGARLRYAGGA